MISQRLPIACLFLAVIMLGSCASKKGAGHEGGDEVHDESLWTEMDDFHMIMAETFHPYKDSANLEPAKRMASELMTAAAEFASADLPERVDNAAMRSKLEQLREQAAAFAETVRSQDDNVVGEQLTALHDTFHEIQDAWYRGH